MLIQANKSMLGDQFLDPKEALAQQKEINKGVIEERKIWGQKELEDHERSAGPRMPYQELIYRIRKLAGTTVCGNPKIMVLEGSPGNVAIYVMKTRKELAETHEDELAEIRQKRPPQGLHPDFFYDYKYATGFPKEDIPEFAHLELDDRGLAKREIRGWRSVLIALIKAGAFSVQEANEEFGEARGVRSHRWFEQLRDYRNL
jgi:hypothetical protein